MQSYGYYIGQIILRLSELKVHISVPMSDGWNSERNVWKDDMRTLRERGYNSDFVDIESINSAISDFEQLATWVEDALKSGPPTFREGLHMRDLLHAFDSIVNELKSRRDRGRLQIKRDRRVG